MHPNNRAAIATVLLCLATVAWTGAQSQTPATANDDAAFVARIPAPTRGDIEAVWRRRNEPMVSPWTNPVITSCTPLLELSARGLPIDRRTTQTMGNVPAGIVRGRVEVRGADELRRALITLPDSAWSYGRVVAIEACRTPISDPESASDVQAVQRMLKRLSVQIVQ